MASDRQRLLELALESLENKRRDLDLEIAELTRQLRGGRGKSPSSPKAAKVTPAAQGGKKKHVRFTKEERGRRSARMTAYWDNWRKQKGREKK
jgi:hypothetical protein